MTDHPDYNPFYINCALLDPQEIFFVYHQGYQIDDLPKGLIREAPIPLPTQETVSVADLSIREKIRQDAKQRARTEFQVSS